jgi:predicted glycoside hydrolase/deacetylase ChbG (UPF0249 family)
MNRSCIVAMALIILPFACPAVWGQSNNGATTQPAAAPAPGATQAGTVATMLGFGPDEKLLIIHGDDAGMCHSANLGTIEAMSKGVVNSASIMVPCPWVTEIAEYCRKHPDADFGVHGTLTSEWKAYRWGPVSPSDQVPGLLDGQGYLWRDVRGPYSRAKPEEIEQELRAQVKRAIAFGIRPTHLDTHMGTVFSRMTFFQAYRKVANEFGLPCLLPRLRPERMTRLSPVMAAVATALTADREISREATLDDLISIEKGTTLETQKQFYIDAIRALRPGITQIIVHCAIDDPELEAVTGSHLVRDMDTRVFTDAGVKRLIESEGVRLITWREIGRRQRDVLGLHASPTTKAGS